jgi:hypothetical protein
MSGLTASRRCRRMSSPFDWTPQASISTRRTCELPHRIRLTSDARRQKFRSLRKMASHGKQANACPTFAARLWRCNDIAVKSDTRALQFRLTISAKSRENRPIADQLRSAIWFLTSVQISRRLLSLLDGDHLFGAIGAFGGWRDGPAGVDDLSALKQEKKAAGRPPSPGASCCPELLVRPAQDPEAGVHFARVREHQLAHLSPSVDRAAFCPKAAQIDA